MDNSNSEKKQNRSFQHFKRLGRELAMQYLFQCDLNEEIKSAGESFYEMFWQQAGESGVFPDNRVFRKGRAYAEKIISGVTANLKEIDDLLAKYSEKWDIERMANVDRNIMRVAVYEMLYCPDIPPVVSINEAVEIAKNFGSEKSGVFINGILNGIKDTLQRPARGVSA